jgi:hypothetical protein
LIPTPQWNYLIPVLQVKNQLQLFITQRMYLYGMFLIHSQIPSSLVHTVLKKMGVLRLIPTAGPMLQE